MPVPIAETIKLDRLDHQLIHALTVDGRAPFRRLAEVLGASEQTVARRYRRLHEAGALRVLVLRDPRGFAESWLMRVQVQPHAAVAFADAVARRPDVAWVALTGGGMEVTFAAVPRSPDERDQFLLERLPRTSQVLGMTAVSILHRFGSGPEIEWHGLPDRLTEAQTAALVPVRDRSAGALPEAADEPLLAVLARDGRASYATVAAAIGDTEARVARRVQALLAGGALMVDVEVATDLVGFPVAAWLWMAVAPSDLDATGRAIALHPEVPFAAAISGTANLVCAVLARSTEDLYRYVTGRLGQMSAVRSVEVSTMLRRFKHAGTRVDGSRLPVS